jgi:hypothetical protein
VDIVARRSVLTDGRSKITTTIDVDKKVKNENAKAKVFYISYMNGK